MSIVTASTPPPTSYRSVPTENPDIEFERRWTAWKARGLRRGGDRCRRAWRVRPAVLVTAGMRRRSAAWVDAAPLA